MSDDLSQWEKETKIYLFLKKKKDILYIASLESYKLLLLNGRCFYLVKTQDHLKSIWGFQYRIRMQVNYVYNET